jgi:hypothetical protein
MNAFLSFVRKDLRLLLRPWLVWMGLFAAKLGLAAWVLTTSEFRDEDNTLALRLNMALTGLVALVGAVLVLWLVQADAPRRAQVFWRTRPISGAQLLAAKALTSALLFFVGPLLLALPWWLVNGMPAADVARSALEMLLVHAAAFAPVFLIAALVDSLRRAVLWSLVQYGGMICLPILGGLFSRHAIDLEHGLAESRVLLAVVLVLLGLPCLIVWQYTRRVSWAAVAGLVLLQTTAVLAWLFSPFNLLPGPGPWTESNRALAEGVELQPAMAARVYEANHHGPGPAPVHVQSIWPITGVPEELMAYPSIITASVSSMEGETMPAKNAFALSPGVRRIYSMLGVVVFDEGFMPPDSPQHSIPAYIGFSVTREMADKLIMHPPTVDVALRVTLARTEIVFNRPLRAGAWHVDSGCGLRIVEVEGGSTLVRVDFATTRATSLLNRLRRYHEGARGRYLADPGFDRSDYLVQPDNGILTSLGTEEPELRILGVGLRRHKVSVSPRPTLQNGNWVPFDGDLAAWRAEFRIARVEIHEVARCLLGGRTQAMVIEDQRNNQRGDVGRAGTETGAR